MLIKIYKIEQLVGKDSGNPYWRLETDNGKMSAFDKPIVDALYEAWHDHKAIQVKTRVSKDGRYVNIYGLGAEKREYDTPEKQRAYDEASKQYAEMHHETYPEVARAMGIPKPQDLGKLRDTASGHQGIPYSKPIAGIDEKGFIKQFNPTSMYVSYAKDIFIGLWPKEIQGVTEQECMKKAENLVKQAHEGFS